MDIAPSHLLSLQGKFISVAFETHLQVSVDYPQIVCNREVFHPWKYLRTVGWSFEQPVLVKTILSLRNSQEREPSSF